MLERIERDLSLGIHRDDLAIDERAGRQKFTCFGDCGELRRESIPSARPQAHAVGILPCQTSIAV